MYNEELKTEFLRRYPDNGTGKVARTILQAMEPYENKWCADLCTRTASELQPAINKVAPLRTESQARQLIILREYARWCMERGVEGACDGIFHVKSGDSDVMRRQMVASPEDLDSCMDQVFPPVETEDITCVYRCYFWMAYSGMREGDIFSVRIEHLDFDNMVIRLDGRTYPIYQEARKAFQLAASLEDFHTTDERWANRGGRKSRYPGREVMRGLRGVFKPGPFRTVISDAFKQSQDGVRNISYKRIHLSGMFYRKLLEERSGAAISFRKEATEYIAVARKGDIESETARGRIKEIASDYMKDYLRWKIIFSDQGVIKN